MIMPPKKRNKKLKVKDAEEDLEINDEETLNLFGP